ncbi:enoyl-ACP reductase [Streptomyces rimosus subsp. rimosus]|nr:enoyl-ACP reductase [Streptomyces rimosus]KOG67520.1 enoyl-ACP reductase [Kitasatospora aureofaciens]KOT28601.1 enoyl-ACP reductase [Streptomyces rimosus subsp. rimosus]KOT29415.1 enoyl-ACP reductase [Streptomyces sp. NRRL WC-3701]KOT48160.1 enoyl-ACP reductase [Streptomyces rimosus subsp. rimosus]
MTTALTELTGVRYPIVQTGMGWVAGPRLVSATAEAGALGILASATMSTGRLRAAVREVAARTDRPFGVNLRADAGDAAERVRIIIEEGVRVASFALAPSRELIARLKDAGVVVIPTVGARRHAEKVAAWGADAVVVQGAEGGGHTGEVATTVLLPQVVDAVDIPVVAAGGFCDGRGLVAALAFGAAGVAMGTRFLLTSDSTVPAAVKARYLAASVRDVTVTRKVDGLPHRMLRTDLVAALERSGRPAALLRAVRHAAAFRKEAGTGWARMVRDGLAMKRGAELTWGQVLLAANTPMMLRAGLVEGRTDAGVLASGQVTGLIDDLPSCAELVGRVMAEAAATLDRLGRAARSEGRAPGLSRPPPGPVPYAPTRRHPARTHAPNIERDSGGLRWGRPERLPVVPPRAEVSIGGDQMRKFLATAVAVTALSTTLGLASASQAAAAPRAPQCAKVMKYFTKDHQRLVRLKNLCKQRPACYTIVVPARPTVNGRLAKGQTKDVRYGTDRGPRALYVKNRAC